MEKLPNLLARADRLSELNVVNQARNVLLSDPFRQALAEGFAPTIHGWIFDLSTGLIRELDLPLGDWERQGLL